MRRVQPNQDENDPLIPLAERDETVCDYQSVSSKELANFVRAYSSKGVKGATRTWGLTGTTSLSIMAINLRSDEKIVVSEYTLPSNCTNTTLFSNPSHFANLTDCSPGAVQNITLEEWAGAFFWPGVAILEIASGFLAVITRFPSVATHRHGLKIVLEKLNSPLTEDEANFFEVIDAELIRIKDVFDLRTDKIFVLVPEDLKKGENHNYPFIEKTLKGIHGERIQFTSDSSIITEEENTTAIRVIHAALSEEDPDLELPNINANIQRFNLRAFFKEPVTALGLIYKVPRFIFIRVSANLLMAQTVFASLMTIFEMDRPDVSFVARLFALSSAFVILVGRVMVNDAFKVTAGYFFLDNAILRIRYWRWPVFRKVIFPALGATVISSLVFFYGYGLGDSFYATGFVKLGHQIMWLIPASENLFMNSSFLSVMGVIGSGLSTILPVSSGFFYFTSGFLSLVEKFKNLCSCNKADQKKEIIYTLREKILIGFTIAATILDGLAFGATTFLFAMNSGLVNRTTNLFWYIREGLGNQYPTFCLILGAGNAAQNGIFGLKSAVDAIRSFQLGFRNLKINNYRSQEAQVGDSQSDVPVDQSSSSDGEGGVNLSRHNFVNNNNERSSGGPGLFQKARKNESRYCPSILSSCVIC